MHERRILPSWNTGTTEAHRVPMRPPLDRRSLAARTAWIRVASVSSDAAVSAGMVLPDWAFTWLLNARRFAHAPASSPCGVGDLGLP